MMFSETDYMWFNFSYGYIKLIDFAFDATYILMIYSKNVVIFFVKFCISVFGG